MRNKFALLPVAGLIFLGSCYYDVEEELYPNNCNTQDMSYSQDIDPIIQQNCTVCHSGATPDAGLDLSDYAGVKSIVDNGKLIDRISRAADDPLLMPVGAKMSDCRISQIESWIAAGAPNNLSRSNIK